CELDPTMHQLQAAGFAPAQLGHISPEIGYFMKPNFMLSARLRMQYVSGLTGKPTPAGANCGTDNYCTPGTSSVAGFVRGSYFMGDGKFRLFLAGELGGGYIRHAQVFPNDMTCGAQGSTARSQCVDSLAGGPFLFGPAFGFLYDFSGAAGLAVSLAADV